MSTQSPRTVEGLKAALTANGLHADEVNRADDPEARKDEGAMLVRTLSDGSCDVITMGRGTEPKIEHFNSEEAAIERLARRLLRPRPPARVRSEAERRADNKRMQEKARRRLAELEALNDAEERNEG